MIFRMGNEEKKLHIRLHVYNTEIAVNVHPDEEEVYRKAAKLITEVMNTYSGIFRETKSEKDIMFMALVHIAVQYQKEVERNDVNPLNDILVKLTSEIEDALS